MFKLSVTLEGPRALEGLDQVAQLSYFSDCPPIAVVIDGERTNCSDWRAALRAPRSSADVFWEDRRKQITHLPKSDQYAFTKLDAFRTPDDALAILEPLPFEICCIGAAFFDEWIAADYERWGFGRSHIDNGWACAFRGAGHDRLVSRRWLDFGPWRVIRRPNDTTFIQFHDLALTDPAEAYEQAKAGLQRMGNDPTGGHIGFHKDRMIASAGKGLYIAEQRLLEVVVGPGNEVRQGDMLCNCALRLHHKQTQPTTGRIDRIAYVFVDEADARAHLHELWLRELECWVADGRGKRRLDADYHPVPDPPAWVMRLG